MREMLHGLKYSNAIVTAAKTANADGNIIDLQGYDACTFLLQVGVVTTADGSNTLALTLAHGDASNLSDAEAVTSANGLIGALPIIDATTDSDKVGAFGYLGTKRYVRVSVVEVGTASAVFGVTAILGRAAQQPVNDSVLA